MKKGFLPLQKFLRGTGLLSFLLFTFFYSFSQQKSTIRGSVATVEGVPIQGATVNIKGTAVGAITDLRGNFSLSGSIGDVLVISSVGYETKETTVAVVNSLITINLTQTASSLGEVVVVGYGTQRKKDVTGSVSNVVMKDIQIPSTPSFDEMLQGKIAGAQISQTSGGPGGGNVNIIIRGISSITGGNSPLYVIDGFPISGTGASTNFNSYGDNILSPGGIINNTQARINPLASINPSDIQSIDILKDASATAIYGSRGANGVIMITTKRGLIGKTKVDVGVSYGLQEVAHKLKLLNSQEYAQFVAEGRDNAYVYATGGSPTDPNNMRPVAQQVRPEFRNPQSITTNTDWQDAIFRTAPVTNAQVSINSGNQNIRVFTSMGYMNQKGIIKTASYDRFTARTNVDAKVSEHFSIGSSLNGSYGYGRFPNVEGHYGTGGVIAQALSAGPTIPLLDQNGKPFFDEDDVTDALGWLANPLDLLDGFSDNRTSTNLLWNNYVEYKINSDWTIKSTIGVQNSTDEIKIWKSTKIPNYTSLNFPAMGGATKITDINWLNENTVNYRKSFGKNKVNALAGLTLQKDRAERLSAGATDFPTENVTYISAGIVNSGTHTMSEWSMVSIIGRVNYSFDDKYLFTASLRRDGSSRFGSNNRWGNFPSFAFAYNISDEDFMQNVNFIDNMKLRLSYGFSGNNQIGNYNFIGLLSPVNYVNNNSKIAGLIPSSLSNVDLGWEKTRQLNIGLDLEIFKNRLSLTVDAYKEQKTNLLLDVQLPAASGFSSSTQNIGDIENKGLEITLKSKNIEGGNFKWSSGITFSANRNKVLRLATEGGRIANSSYQITEVGQPIASFYLLHAIGIFMNSKELENAALQHPRTQAGDVKFEDVDGNKVINTDDRKIVGTPWPDFTWGFTNSLSFKNLSLDVSLVGSQGAKTYYRWGTSLLNSAGVQNQLARFSLGRWISEDQPGDGYQPRAIRNNYAFAFSDNTSRFLFNSSYVRIKNVNLTYNFDKTLASRIGFAGLAVYFNVTNLATFTDYPGYDPEASSSGSDLTQPGIDYNAYPLARTFTFGINLSF